MMRLRDDPIPETLVFRAAQLDALRCIEWRLAGQPGGRPPASVLAALRGEAEDSPRDVQSFGSPEEFEAALAAAKGG